MEEVEIHQCNVVTNKALDISRSWVTKMNVGRSGTICREKCQKGIYVD